MKFNLKQALSFCTKDEDFAKKMFIGWIFIALCIIVNRVVNILTANTPKDIATLLCVIVLTIISTILTIIPYGYEVENSHSRLIQDEIPLCDWSNKLKKLKYGFLSCVVPSLSWGLIAVAICLGFIFFSGFLYSLIEKAAQGYILNIFSACVFIVLFLIMAAAIAVVEASHLSYIVDLNVKSFFNLKTIKKIMFENFRKYVNYFGNIIILGFLQTLIMILLIALFTFISQFSATVLSSLFMIDDISAPIMYVLSICIISPVIMYFYFVYSDVKAQFLKMIANENGEG